MSSLLAASDAGGASALSLPLDALLNVLAACDAIDRRLVFPLVCTQWSAACREPSELWSRVLVHDDEQHHRVGGGVCFALLRAWLLHRVRHIAELHLRFCSRRHDLSAGSLAALLPKFATTGMLRQLCLGLPSTKLQPGDFAALGRVTSLAELELEAGCRAGVVQPALQALGSLTALRSLDVRMHLGGSAGAREFPDRLCQLTRLRRLRLGIANVDFAFLPCEITCLSLLQDLELADCFLLPNLALKRKPLPEGFGSLPLTRLRLAPFAFGAELDRHGFASDPLAEVTGLTRLRELALEQCQVDRKAFDVLNPMDNLAALTSLTSLSLRESPIIAQRLPRFMVLDQLLSADLSRCELERVPSCIRHASALRSLTLAHNMVHRFPDAAQVHWPSLTALNMRNNYLESLPTFQGAELRDLCLKYNGPLLQFEPHDVVMLSERWPQLKVLDVDRGKNVDVGPRGNCLPPPRWTYLSLCIAFDALAKRSRTSDVKIILHRGPTVTNEVVLTPADVYGDSGCVLCPDAAYDMRFS